MNNIFQLGEIQTPKFFPKDFIKGDCTKLWERCIANVSAKSLPAYLNRREVLVQDDIVWIKMLETITTIPGAYWTYGMAVDYSGKSILNTVGLYINSKENLEILRKKLIEKRFTLE